jgi:hypothetical protein
MKLSVRSRFVSNVLAMAYREATIMRHDKAFMAVLRYTAHDARFGARSNKPANVPGPCSTTAAQVRGSSSRRSSRPVISGAAHGGEPGRG